jgi:hypothetical protein
MEEERKGFIMDGIAILAMWFASVIIGMILTMIMPQLFADTRGNEVYPDKTARTPSQEMLHVEVLQGCKASMALVEERA